jgi:hypothetical protein
MGIDPVSIAAIGGMAATAAGGGLKAFGSYEGGQASKAALAYQSQVAAYNSQVAKQNAAWDSAAGEAQANARGLKTRAQVGSTIAKMGAAGVSTNSGSAATTTAGEREIGMLDAMTIRSNASREAYGQEVAATSDTAQSQLDTMEANQAGEAGDIGAAGSLLSSAGTFGGQFAQYQKSFGSTGVATS